MKHFFKLALLLWLVPAALYSQQARFDEATFLLEQNEYRKALDIYKTIADDGFQSGSLWLNMGIAYTALDSLGMAKYYFLQAENLDETESAASEALAYVNERFERRSAVLPQLPWDRFFNFLANRLGTGLLFTFAFILLYGGTAGIIAGWFYPVRSTLLKYLWTGMLISSGLVFAAAFYTDYLETRYGTGVIIEREQPVYQAPNTDTATVSTAYEGYVMRVDLAESESTEGWSYVRLENGMYGWLQTESMKVF
ncbi:hypothetical protein [Rhodohalobacter mucosus]|uniref:Uncharacterized protein n=1 Tax=Rhodohalobacter mucosus TaxID=2079485 RepID=A0A316TMH9_9BACT|nr:hypothetical protein [Rhodohalobacter mucosus]PWN05620.1 hypothetical protein DDZ15_13560 [Rhodohalobacter mucosus]